MKEVKLSVVMSVYNGESYLRDAIESILNQTFKDFEFIIIDDGSEDASEDIIRSYDDSRIKFVQQDNAGLPIALNKGIDLAKGEYIVRMDADDISVPDRLKIQFDFMKAHSDVDILGGRACLIDERGKEIGEKIKPTDPMIIKRALEYACPVIHPTYIVRTSVYRKLNGYRSCFPVGQDYDFLLRANDLGMRISNLSKGMLYYRVNTKGTNPNRVRFQMFVTRMALRLHRQRVKYGCENSDLLKRIAETSISRAGVRFSFAYRYRNTLLLRARRVTGIRYKIMMLGIFAVSLVDFELLCSSLRGLRYKKSCSEESGF